MRQIISKIKAWNKFLRNNRGRRIALRAASSRNELAAIAAEYRKSEHPVVLHILHGWGGGTEKHVRDLCRLLESSANHLLLMPDPAVENLFRLLSTSSGDSFDLTFVADTAAELSEVIRSFSVRLVHLHHIVGYKIGAIDAVIAQLSVPYVVTIHDYFFACPRINLMPPKKYYCGEPSIEVCQACLSRRRPHGVSDIVRWRESNARLLQGSLAVICPSIDARNRMFRLLGNLPYVVVPHDQSSSASEFVKLPVLKKGDMLRVAVIGAILRHKGAELLAEIISDVVESNLPIRFDVIGYLGDVPQIPNSKHFSQTGAYVDSQLPSLIESADPHLILYLARCPETYCYTLSAALESARPIMAPDLGAFPERLDGRPWTWIYEWNLSGREIVAKLEEAQGAMISNHPPVAPEVSMDAGASTVCHDFYTTRYLDFLSAIGN